MTKPLHADEYQELQRLVDALYQGNPYTTVTKIDIEVRAEVEDLCDDLMEVIHLIPAGTYKRERLVDQINSIVTAHGWGFTYGTVS